MKRLVRRQQNNKIKALIEAHHDGVDKLPKNFQRALDKMSPELEKLFAEIMPIVKKARQKEKVYILVPSMDVLEIWEIHGSWIIRAKILQDISGFKKGQEVTLPLKSLVDSDGGAWFSNEKGEIYTPAIEKIIIEKEVIKKEKIGFSKKEIEKSINDVLHKSSALYLDANKKMFDEFLNNLEKHL